ncbi:FtsX-like permease family protein [Haladaptatus sp. NG-SE-30]
MATSSQTTTIAEEYAPTGQVIQYESVSAARNGAPQSALVIPIAEVTLPDGKTRYVAGISPERRDAFAGQISTPPETGVSSGIRQTTGKQQLQGHQGSESVRVEPRPTENDVLPPQWYLGRPAVVDQLGPTGAVVITPANAHSPVPDNGSPIRAALAFFIAGTRQLLAVVTVTAVGGAVLTAVTVHSVTRMTVRDRREAIRVLRATGGTPSTIRRLFALRSGLLTLVGIALGYAFGVILTRSAANLAVFAGVPTSLAIRVTGEIAMILIGIFLGVLGVGIVAGWLASWPATNRPPAARWDTTISAADHHDDDGLWHRLRSPFHLLDWRPLVPSVASLAVFATIAIVLLSFVGVASPLLTTSGTTITEPGAVHPVASKVPTQYASVLRADGIAASPEILVFTVHDGNPVVVRGANYSAFATVSNATLVRGQRPSGSEEAVVGADLARTLDVGVGDRLTLGGSTTSTVAQVQVVGVFSAPGPFDDQLLVSLPTARHLSRAQSGMVNFIRTNQRLKQSNTSASGITVLDVSASDRVTENQSLPVRITVKNLGASKVRREIPVTLGTETRTVSVHLEPTAQRTVTVQFAANQTGAKTLRVREYTQNVTIVESDSLQLRGLPRQVPPGSEPLVTVTTASGTPVQGATISVGNQTVRTNANGSTRVPFESVGTVQVTVQYQDQTIEQMVRVRHTAERVPSATIQIQPTRPTITSQPTARVQLRNPWNTTIDRQITLTYGGKTYTRNVSLPPGGRTTFEIQVGRHTPGTHTLRVTSEGQSLGTHSFTVTGDDRLVAAYMHSGNGATGTGIGNALTTAVGNLNLLVGILVALAALMTIGSTTATLAYAVHTRRRAIGVYRATGVAPWQLVKLVLSDVLWLAVPTIGLALVIAFLATVAFAHFDLLTLYGIRIRPMLSPVAVVGIVAVGIVIMLTSALLVVAGLLKQTPTTLMATDRGGNPETGQARGELYE